MKRKPKPKKLTRAMIDAIMKPARPAAPLKRKPKPAPKPPTPAPSAPGAYTRTFGEW